ETDTHIWSEIYDREKTGLFAVQSAIAREIASTLQLELSPQVKARIEKAPTTDITAYDLYLRGKEKHHAATWAHVEGGADVLPKVEQDYKDAVTLYERALERDPKFALAYTGLAKVYAAQVKRVNYPRELMDTALEMAKQAVSLDPDSAESFATLAGVYNERLQFAKGLETAEKACQLDPNHADAWYTKAWSHRFLGERDESLAAFRKCTLLDPGNLRLNASNLAWEYAVLGYPDRVDEWGRKMLELDPSDPWGFLSLSWSAIFRGDLEEAWALSQEGLDLNQGKDTQLLHRAGLCAELCGDLKTAQEYYERIDTLAWREVKEISLPRVLWRQGRREEAEVYLSQLERRAQEAQPIRSDVLAEIYAIRGEKEKACQRLSEAVARGWKEYYSVQIDPTWDNLREESCFQKLMAGVKVDIDEMRKRVEEMEKEWEP
ncbi:MAG: TPR end-of-group domain-containing protein, partial [bacterium]